MSDWKVFPLGDIATVFDGPHATPTKTASGPWYLSISSLKRGRFDLAESAHLSDEQYPRWTRRVAPEVGDTLFSYETRIGESAFWNLNVRAALGRRMGLLRPKRDVVDPRFLAMSYLAPDFQELIRMKTVHGATVDRLLIADMPNWPIALPPLPEQQRIAAVLAALDDLIDHNRRLASDLVETVGAGFSRAFGALDLSLPLGDIADVIDCLHSKKPDRVDAGSNVLVQLNNIRDNGIFDPRHRYLISDDDYARWSKKFETRTWDCVITNVGRIGAVSRIPAGYRAAIGRNMTSVRPRRAADGAFVIASLTSAPVRREIELRTDSGTVMNSLNVRNIPLLRLPSADERERSEFHMWAGPLLEAADAVEAEANELSSTRDELLPLLMSGRARVRDVEGLVA